ncbi:MAG: hypothetical protein ACO2OR_00465 [Desulfurococcaceae archaeon]
MRPRVHTSIDVYDLYLRLVEAGVVFVTVDYIARLLAIPTRSAGRILSRMRELGLAVRISKNAYRLVRP